MKGVASFMVFAGLVIAYGAILEFFYFGPGTRQFTAGLVATPAGILFAAAGIALWRRGRSVRTLVVGASAVLLIATVAGIALDVMGPPAYLLGIVASLTAIAAVQSAAKTDTA